MRRSRLLRDFLTDTSGANAIEYALIAALISVFAIVTMSQIGENLSETLTRIAEAMHKANRLDQ